jgi:GDP-4-dehydro-6-deoxy-D-mannose reductase
MKKVLITGGTGFAGSHLLELLLEDADVELHVTTFSAPDPWILNVLPAEHIHTVDLADVDMTKELLAELQPACIYHLASLAVVGTSHRSPAETIQKNSALQVGILEAVRLASPQSRVLSVGSAQGYDCHKLTNQQQRINETHPLGPSNPYGVSKVTQELLSLSYMYSYGLDIVLVRSFNHTGERQTTDFALPSFAQQIVAIEKGHARELKVGNLAAVRDISDVKDVVHGYKILMDKGSTGEVYNLGSGSGVVMKDALQLLIDQSTVPISVIVDQEKFRPLDVPYLVADNKKIVSLGWQPHHELAETCGRILSYWRNQ